MYSAVETTPHYFGQHCYTQHTDTIAAAASVGHLFTRLLCVRPSAKLHPDSGGVGGGGGSGCVGGEEGGGVALRKQPATATIIAAAPSSAVDFQGASAIFPSFRLSSATAAPPTTKAATEVVVFNDRSESRPHAASIAAAAVSSSFIILIAADVSAAADLSNGYRPPVRLDRQAKSTSRVVPCFVPC